ncbi:MAG: DUF4350 domain-containing protein [Actinomycetota bacterium]
MSRRVVALWLAVVVLIGVLLVLVPRGESADATLALRRFLAHAGVRISEGEAPPAPGGTFVLLRDLRDDEDARALLRWAARGGRLVVADPSSPSFACPGSGRRTRSRWSATRPLSRRASPRRSWASAASSPGPPTGCSLRRSPSSRASPPARAGSCWSATTARGS